MQGISGPWSNSLLHGMNRHPGTMPDLKRMHLAEESFCCACALQEPLERPRHLLEGLLCCTPSPWQWLSAHLRLCHGAHEVEDCLRSQGRSPDRQQLASAIQVPLARSASVGSTGTHTYAQGFCRLDLGNATGTVRALRTQCSPAAPAGGHCLPVSGHCGPQCF